MAHHHDGSKGNQQTNGGPACLASCGQELEKPLLNAIDEIQGEASQADQDANNEQANAMAAKSKDLVQDRRWSTEQ